MITEFKMGAKAALPTVLGYISIGIACGIVASKSGLSPLEMGMMSILIYSGSGQFVLCALLVAKAPLSAIAMTIFLVNIRHFLMNLHVSTIFSEANLWKQLLIGSFMTDESYGVLLGERIKKADISPNWMYGNNFASYFSWCMSCIFGCLLGNLIPNPESLGIDFALLAMFVAILVSQLEGMVQTVPIKIIVMILLSVTVSYIGLTFFVSESLAVLLSTLIGCSVGVCLHD